MESVNTSNSESVTELSKTSTDKDFTECCSEKNDDKKSEYDDDIGKY